MFFICFDFLLTTKSNILDSSVETTHSRKIGRKVKRSRKRGRKKTCTHNKKQFYTKRQTTQYIKIIGSLSHSLFSHFKSTVKHFMCLCLCIYVLQQWHDLNYIHLSKKTTDNIIVILRMAKTVEENSECECERQRKRKKLKFLRLEIEMTLSVNCIEMLNLCLLSSSSPSTEKKLVHSFTSFFFVLHALPLPCLSILRFDSKCERTKKKINAIHM